MFTAIGRLGLLVHDYDQALEFYVKTLGFEPIVDIRTPEGQRFVHVGPPSQQGIGLWFLLATTEEARARVGRQTAGEPCFVLYTDDLALAHEQLRARGVRFHREPREDHDAVFAHFCDLYGNEIVLVELRAPQQ